MISFKLIDKYGWNDRVWNHVSIRHPNHPKTMLINGIGYDFNDI